MREVSDVLSDYQEVQTVVHGGHGSRESGDASWGTYHCRVPDTPAADKNADTLSTLPFAASDIPTEFLAPAKPVIKTNSLPTFTLKYNGGCFIDRVLPTPAAPILGHERFTPNYYVALHNLAAGPGHDGRGFWYPANTPNYRGARIPLVHTGLNIENWRKHLIGYGEADELVQFMIHGFPLGLADAPKLTPCDRNHGSAYQFYPHLDKFVVNEIKSGGLTGPFKSPPWTDLMLSPLMTAPKKPSSRRSVFDATFGEDSLNNSTPGDQYLGTPTIYTYPKIDDMHEIILRCGQGCFLWKRDLHRFYLQIPMDPVDYRNVGFVWRGLFFLFIALMFGLRHSGLQGQRITDAVSWIHRRAGLNTPGERLFNCINYSDDLGGGEESRSRSVMSFNKLGELLAELGLVESTDKASSPSTSMVYLGIQFDTVAMTMSVPPEKLAEVKAEIVRWCKKTTATKRPFQSLLGKLFWISKVVRHSRTFMGRLLAQLREMTGKPDSYKARLSEDCMKDLTWWERFLKEYNGVTMIKNQDAIKLTLDQLLDKPSTICVGDATLTGGGAWHGQQYWSRQLPDQLKDPTIPVHVKEFLVVIVSTRLWGDRWSGQVIQIFCDNDAVCDVVEGERPSDSRMLSLLREFKYWVCKYRFYPVMRKISSADNHIADHISRRHDDDSAQSVFTSNSLGPMRLVDIPDKYFDLTAPW